MTHYHACSPPKWLRRNGLKDAKAEKPKWEIRGGQETASEFLAAITQHIPDKGAQMVRY